MISGLAVCLCLTRVGVCLWLFLMDMYLCLFKWFSVCFYVNEGDLGSVCDCLFRVSTYLFV